MENKDKLKQMMEDATSTEQIEVKSASEPKSIFKLVGISLAVVVAIVGLGFGAKTLLTMNENKAGTNTGGEGTNIVTIKADDLPVRVPTFALTTYDKATFDASKTNVDAVSGYANDYALRNAMPEVMSITEEGVTNDVTKRLSPEGGLNLLYRTALVEDYEYAFGVATQRFLNPLFGGWATDGKTMGELNADLFADMLTPEYLARAQADMNVLPIPSTSKLYFGNITTDEDFFLNEDMNAEFTDEGPIYTFNLKVKLGAFNEDSSIEEKTGKLTISFVENDNLESNDQNRVLVSDASFTFE